MFFYRFNKYCLYESSVRIPLILSGSALPRELRGTVDERAVELVDVYPTILASAGIDIPEALPGLDLLGAGSRGAGFCALHERQDEAAFMWRTQRYKLILRMNRHKAIKTGCGHCVLHVIKSKRHPGTSCWILRNSSKPTYK